MQLTNNSKDNSGLPDNKRKILGTLFKELGDGTVKDQLNCMEAFENLLDEGYIEQFVNDKGELDYRISNRFDANKFVKEISD